MIHFCKGCDGYTDRSPYIWIKIYIIILYSHNHRNQIKAAKFYHLQLDNYSAVSSFGCFHWCDKHLMELKWRKIYWGFHLYRDWITNATVNSPRTWQLAKLFITGSPQGVIAPRQQEVKVRRWCCQDKGGGSLKISCFT